MDKAAYRGRIIMAQKKVKFYKFKGDNAQVDHYNHQIEQDEAALANLHEGDTVEDVTAATDVDGIITSDDFQSAISEIENQASYLGYEMVVTSDTTIDVTSIDKDKDFMPAVHLKTVTDESGIVAFDATMTFPEQLDSTEFDYVDSIEAYTQKYAKVGKLVTLMLKFTFNPDMEYED